MTPGLYHHRDQLRLQQERKRAIVNSQDSSPQQMHAARIDVETLEREIQETNVAIIEDEKFVRDFNGLLNELYISKYKSRHRSLLVTQIEDAQSRVMRELGEKTGS